MTAPHLPHPICRARKPIFLDQASVFLYFLLYVLHIVFKQNTLQVKKKGNLSKIVFLSTSFDVFGANDLLPLLGSVHRNVIIKSQRK